MTRNEIISALAARGIEAPIEMADEIPGLSLTEAVAWAKKDDIPFDEAEAKIVFWLSG